MISCLGAVNPEDFDATFQQAKEFHQKNILSGKVGKGNFGKYLNTYFDSRIKVLDEQEREEAERQRREAWYASLEYRQKRENDEKAAAADPLHPYFEPTVEAVLERVEFDESPFRKLQLWDRFNSKLHRHLRKTNPGSNDSG